MSRFLPVGMYIVVIRTETTWHLIRASLLSSVPAACPGAGLTTHATRSQAMTAVTQRNGSKADEKTPGHEKAASSAVQFSPYNESRREQASCTCARRGLMGSPCKVSPAEM